MGQLTGAGKGARTLDLNLGKVALYQLSYSREIRKRPRIVVPQSKVSTLKLTQF